MCAPSPTLTLNTSDLKACDLATPRQPAAHPPLSTGARCGSPARRRGTRARPMDPTWIHVCIHCWALLHSDT